jgi:hypothetical protein
VSVTFPQTGDWHREEEPEPVAGFKPDPPPTAKSTADRLELYFAAREQERHVHSLFRDVENGREDLINSIPIMRRASARLAAALEELDQ